MKRALLIVCSFCFLASACTQRSICPAFQSAYIYDKEALRKKFSYFQEDSTPKILTASKNKYLIAEAVPYRRKIARISTIEMKDVMPVVPDSLTMDYDVSLAELDAAARSVIDSIYIVDVEPNEADSLAGDEELEYMISKDKEVRVLRYNKDSISYKVEEVRYNVDQDNYMWYLRDAIVLPDIRLLQLQAEAKEETAAKKERKGIRGFFRNLFKKKDREEPSDSTDLEPPVERSEYDLDYVEDENAKPAPEPTKKKGLFKKKDKSAVKKENGADKEEGKVSSGKQRPPKKEKKPKQEKPDKIKSEDEKPPDSEVKGEEGF